VPEERGVVRRTKGDFRSVCFASRCRIPEPAGGACPASSVRRNCPQKEEFFMYPHPFSVGYWRTAANELKDVRKLTFAALCIALCMALAAIPSVPLWGGAKITWGFLARAVCAWVCGPVLGVVFAVAEDLLSFFITGGGGYPFFPGYTLTTMLGVFVYSLFFYKSKITFSRAFWAKLLTNIQNVILGALWMAILSGKAWYVTASGSAIKNLICLPFQAILLYTLFTTLRPFLVKMRLIE